MVGKMFILDEIRNRKNISNLKILLKIVLNDVFYIILI